MNRYIVVRAYNIKAIFSFDEERNRIKTLICSNKNLCRDLRILNPDGSCPRYCLILVACRDYISGLRIPKIKGEVEELDPEVVKNIH